MSVWLASFYRIVHYMSIDVAIGACAGMYFFAKVLEVPVSTVSYLILAMAVWVVYTFDHLLDARFSPGELVSARHRFHSEHFRVLSLATFLVAVAGLFLAWYFLPSRTIFFMGALLAALIFSAMVFTQYFKEQMGPIKEITIAVLYVAGLVMLPLMQGIENIYDWRWLHYVATYLLLAWFNLVFLSLLDHVSDERAGQKSMVSALGTEKVKRFLNWLGFGGILYTVSLFFILPSGYHVFSLIVLILFMWHVRYFLEGDAPSDKVRRKLEAAFFLPWVLVLLA